jgi:hypothetical protein
MTWRRLLSEARVKDRHRVVRAILALSATDTLGGVGHQQKSGLLEDPDDGGFLASSPESMAAN